MTLRALTLFSLLLTAACGYGPSLTVACSDYAQAMCDLHERCAGDTYYPRTFADRQTCVRRFELACSANATAKDSRVEPLALEACVQSLVDPAFSCVDLQSNTFVTSCHMQGSRPNGASCGTGSQCQTGFCNGVKTMACGTCSPAPTPGASCATSGCASGQVCQSPQLQCNVLVAGGGACVYEGPSCEYGFTCSASATTTSGTCEPVTAMLGDSCVTARCDGFYSLTCNTSTHVCQQVQFAFDGDACGSPVGAPAVACASGGNCYLPDNGGIATGAATGTCKQAATDGAACDIMIGPPCATPARCVLASAGSTSGTCQLANPGACN